MAMKKKAGLRQEGIFSLAVYLAKTILGEDELDKVRAKAISLHLDVIKSFVETANSSFGQHALVAVPEKQITGILKQVDQDKNDVIDFQEFVSEVPKTLKMNLVKLAKKNGGE
eukprot:14447702-Ditylum_brightwellii.AAC.1